MESIKKFCNKHGFKEVRIIAKDRYVRSISSKEWFAIEIFENKIRLSYENYNLEKPFVRDNNLNMDYIQYLIEIDKLDEFIKKEFILDKFTLYEQFISKWRCKYIEKDKIYPDFGIDIVLEY